MAGGMGDVNLKDCADYDHCLVFPTNDLNDFTDYGKLIMENIQALGYETYIFKVEGMKKFSYLEYFCCSFPERSDSSDQSDDDDELEVVSTSDDGIAADKRASTFTSSLFNFTFASTKPKPKPKKRPTNEPITIKRRAPDQDCLIFVLLRTPLHKLREFAERMELRMLVDPYKAKEILAEGDPEHNIKRVILKFDPEISNLSPYDCIYSRYKKNREFLYWKGEDFTLRHDGSFYKNPDMNEFLSTAGDISRYYSKHHIPAYETRSLYSHSITNSASEDIEDNQSDEDLSVNENANIYRFSALGKGAGAGSISTYNTPAANSARNCSNSAILRNHPFRDLLRIKISNFMLQSRPRIIRQNYILSTIPNLKIQRLLKRKRLLGSFVLHNPAKTLFQTHWARYPFFPLPIYDIKEYFGEKLGFFYAFLDHYNTLLFFPMVIAIPLQVCVFYYNDYGAPFIPIYSILLPLWACYMSENWKMKERFYSLQWGMMGYNEIEQFRPEFKGEERDSGVDGRKEHYFPQQLRSRRITLSMLVVCSLLFLVVGSVIGVYLLRATIMPVMGGSLAQIVVSIINALIIQGLNRLYFTFSVELTEWENHRTQTEFENTMIQKLFVLQFVNSYGSLFYLAFMAPYIGDCPADVGCMPALAWNLGTILVVRFILEHVIANMMIPSHSYESKLKDYAKRMCGNRSHILQTPTIHTGTSTSATEEKRLSDSSRLSGTSSNSPITFSNTEGSNSNYITSIERDFVKNQLNVEKYELQIFSDVMIQFGYNSLFISALPLTSCFTFFTNVFQMRYESQLLFYCYQRPNPRSAENIGAWQDIMEILSSLSVITNGALMIFSMQMLKAYDFSIQLWAFILFQWINWILQSTIKNYVVPHHKEAITVQLKRQKFIISKLIYQESDDTQGWEAYHGYTPEIFRPIPQW